MTTALTLSNPLMQKLARVERPEESKEIESLARAAQAWAKENQDYESLVQAVEIYVLARRKTTELVKPLVKHGGNKQGHIDATLLDMGFTKQQWNRRTKELEIPEQTMNEYFDECTKNGWHPSLAGLVRHAYQHERPNKATGGEIVLCPACGAVIQR